MFFLQIFSFLVILSLGFASPESKKMMDRLTDMSAWFGKAAKTCTSRSIKCFNLRKGHYESILQRAGLTKHYNLTKKLKVVFQAKEEGVDVCGKTTVLDAVPRFELPDDGHPLFRQAEDYRNPPNVSWHAETGELYSLVHFDVGFFKIRGWWYNVEKQRDKTFKGEINIRYSPPANPTPNLNPILILLLRQDGPKIYSPQEWHRTCSKMSPSPRAANSCRSKFIKMVSELTIVGMQVYYTQGYSQYEQYRACTESLPCNEDCIEKFARYVSAAQSGAHGIKFMNVDDSQLDHYVNIHFYSLGSHPKSELPFIGEFMVPQPKAKKSKSDRGVRYVDVRARPGDDMKIRNSDTLINANKKIIMMNVEIGVPLKYFEGSLQTYSVLIVDQDAPGMSEKPYGHYYVANLKLPDILGIKSEYQPFVDFTPPNGFHRYHILLFSQERFVTGNILGPNAMGWNLDMLTENHKLRAISWMVVNFNDDIDCPTCGEGGCLKPQPFTSEYVGIADDFAVHHMKHPTPAVSNRTSSTGKATNATKSAKNFLKELMRLDRYSSELGNKTAESTNRGRPGRSVLSGLVCVVLLVISSFQL